MSTWPTAAKSAESAMYSAASDRLCTSSETAACTGRWKSTTPSAEQAASAQQMTMGTTGSMAGGVHRLGGVVKRDRGGGGGRGPGPPRGGGQSSARGRAGGAGGGRGTG